MEYILQLFETYATQVPLTLYVSVGSFVEEILAPIPSPLIMSLAGSIAHVKGHGFFYLTFLAFLGAGGKTIACYLLYLFGDKGEDVVSGIWGKFFGVSHAQIEKLGKHMGSKTKTLIIMTVLRAIPIVPSAPVSVIAGIVRVSMREYIIGTFTGTVIRNILYLYFGYTSFKNISAITTDLDSLETVGMVSFFVLAAVIGAAYYLRRKL